MVQPNGDLLGHGVNVAARLMARSEPGSGLVSGAVHQTIRGPVAEPCYGHLGRHQEARAVPGGFAPPLPTELRWRSLFRDGGFQAILDEGLAPAAEDAPGI